VSWFGAAWQWYLTNATIVSPLGTFVAAAGAFATAATLAWAGVRNARTAALRHEEQTRADRQRRITESFSKATEQLASEKIEGRLGGIYTLERISRESPDDYWVVMETLTAFLREHGRWKKQDKLGSETLMSRCDDEKSEDILRPRLGTDIAAVLAVDKNVDRERMNNWFLDFRGTDLKGAFLAGAHLERASFAEVHLERAFLWNAHLEEAAFYGAHLEEADLSGAHLEHASFERAHLEGVNLKVANLREANLKWAHLRMTKGLVQDQITLASGNSETTLPQGLTRPEHWTRVS
jgi:hypothetical protein